MSDHGNHSSFEQFQQLVAWLNLNMQSNRKGRRFLETNTVLLETETDRELARLIEAYALDGPDLEQQMVQHLALLRNAREREHSSGNSIQAIREAYINAYGGASLDFPPPLVPTEDMLLFLDQLRRPERTSKTRITLLREALQHAEQKDSIAPELAATLRNELGRTLAHEYHPLTQSDYRQALEEAVACHESALLIYTFGRYPLRYADTCSYLGRAWLQLASDVSDRCRPARDTARQAGAVERALACFVAALHVYQRTAFPEQWATLQSLLGRAYTLRMAGEPAENLERAIAYHKLALQVATPERFPTLWASIHILLGDAYRLRKQCTQADNFRRATSCYEKAQQVFSQKLYPAQWAAIHIGRAYIYQHATGGNVRDIDKRQACAIVCYETALNVYTPDSFPVERAATLLKLGDLHSTRCGGARATNLKEAITCYQAASHIFTSDAFPLEQPRVQQKLSDARAQHEKTQPITV